MSRMPDSKARRPRRQFDEDFKAQAVRLVLDEGTSVGAVARDLDLTESALRQWVEHARADRSGGRTGLPTAERDELAKRRKENRVLRMEHEILGKPSGSAGAALPAGPETPGWLSSQHPGRSGRLLFGDASNP